MDKNAAEAQKPQNPEPEKAPVRFGFAEGQPGTFCLEIDLNRINPAWARGALLNADDVIKSWYRERQAVKAAIIKPGSTIQSIFKKLGVTK